MAENDPLEQARKAQERLRDLVDPPAARWLREQDANAERVRDTLDPPALRWLREQQATIERLHDLFDPPAFRRLRAQEAGVRPWREVLGAAALEEVSDQQRRMKSLFASPVAGGFPQNKVDLEKIDWESLITPQVAAEVQVFQADIADRVISAAEGVSEDYDEETVWFGAASWSALVAEIEGLLKALEVIVAAMTGSQIELGPPIPTAVLALLIVLVSATEFALWLVKRDLGE